MTIDTDDAYTDARLRGARSKLIRRAEYDKLMRMSDAEIIAYLQTTSYRPDVDALGVKDLDDLEAIDRIITRHEDRTLRWLLRIATPRYERIIRTLQLENDVWNLRIVAEAIGGSSDVPQAIERFARIGTIPAAAYGTIRTFPELARAATRRFPTLTTIPDDLVGFLDALERAHAAESLPDGIAGALLADERNLIRVLRCVRDGVAPDRAIAGTARGGTLSRGVLRRIASAPAFTDALRLLRETRYALAAERALAAGDDAPVRIEHEIHRAILRALAQTALAQPQGPGMLARHIAETGMESANLRLLVKARRLGWDESFIKERLAVP